MKVQTTTITLALSLLVPSALAQNSADPAAGITPGVHAQPASQSGTFGMNDALDFVPGSGLCGLISDQTIGWQFDVLQPVTVTAMSWFDENGDGVDIDHEVAIWDPSGAIIATTNVIIPQGTAATLDGNWRTVSIPPTTLPAGTGYIVGGYHGVGSTQCLSFNVSQTVNPAINYVDATFSAFGPTLDIPFNFSGADNGFYGVGFQVGDGGGPGSYCDAGANSVSASGALLSSTGGFGTASATFLITNTPDQPGILFSGPNQLDVPFGCGNRCVGGSVVRGDVTVPAGNQAMASFDMSLPNTINIQWWYRDPANAPCGASFNLSNALMP